MIAKVFSGGVVLGAGVVCIQRIDSHPLQKFSEGL